MRTKKRSGALPPMTEQQLRQVTIGEPRRLEGQVVLVPYDLAWPDLFQRESQRIRQALAGRALRVEHVGSTSVPGLTAKPIIDILLVVPDSSDEPSYAPALEAVGYRLRIREPDWHQHRLFKGADTEVNVHVFSPGSPEIDRMLTFRERLRSDPRERALYARTKRALARKKWGYVQNYADAKSAVVEAILERERASPSPTGRDNRARRATARR